MLFRTEHTLKTTIAKLFPCLVSWANAKPFFPRRCVFSYLIENSWHFVNLRDAHYTPDYYSIHYIRFWVWDYLKELYIRSVTFQLAQRANLAIIYLQISSAVVTVFIVFQLPCPRRMTMSLQTKWPRGYRHVRAIETFPELYITECKSDCFPLREDHARRIWQFAADRKNVFRDI